MKTCLLAIAASALVVAACSTPEPVKEFTYAPVPEEYKVEAEKIGTLERVEYTAADHEGDMIDKHAYVYVPYGYDPSKKYEVVYIMHGGSGYPSFYLGTQEEPKMMKHMFDHMMANGDIPPVLLVMPTYYNDPKPRTGQSTTYVDHFQKELGEKLIPLVEGKYSTYAKDNSEKELIASRDHRYFTGFSMGGATTWSVFAHNLRYFRTFLPMSGDSWAVSALGGKSATEETVDILIKSVADQGYTSKDFYIFSLTGNKDMAEPNLLPQIELMKTHTEMFSYGPDQKRNNFYFYDSEGGEHNADYYANYLYSALPFVLK